MDRIEILKIIIEFLLIEVKDPNLNEETKIQYMDIIFKTISFTSFGFVE